MTYSVAGYGRMIADRVRVAAYTRAMEQAIKPGSTVLDIGTGTGFFAMLACRLGARKVYAIEPDDVIKFARAAAQANGYTDRIDFIQDLSTRIDLPEPVDVVVSDLRTVLPWFQQHIPTIVDARSRLLKPGGTLIPARDTLWAAIVEMPEFYADQIGHQPEDTEGFDMSATWRHATTAWAKTRARPDQYLGQPLRWAELDYAHVEETNVNAELDWTVNRSGSAHGLVAWFDTILLGETGFSNSPASEPTLYGHAFFPFPRPVSVAAGDAVSIALRAHLLGSDYIWTWKSRFTSADRETKAIFSQNNLIAPPTLKTLRHSAASHIPNLNDRAAVDRFILEQMDGSVPLLEIAEAVVARFPSQYTNREQAFVDVAELSVRYSQ